MNKRLVNHHLRPGLGEDGIDLRLKMIILWTLHIGKRNNDD